MKTKVKIRNQTYQIEGDIGYLKSIAGHFEPATVKLMNSFCSTASHVIDVGANIGLTALALASTCPQGQIVAIEPVPKTFNFLQENIKNSGLKNITAYHFAAGERNSTVQMHGNETFLAGAFVGDKYSANFGDHFSTTVPLTKLDDIFIQFGMNHIDFIKIDVEGYELSVLNGAKDLLNQFKPIVMMEMNHWCLNMLQNITLPEFRASLFKLFPYVFAIDKTIYCDLTNDAEFHEVAHAHLTNFKFMNIIAGFDKEKIIKTLKQNHYVSFLEAPIAKRKALHNRFNFDLSVRDIIKKLLKKLR